MNTATAIQFIADNPYSTAKEAGLTNAEANALVGQGKLVAVGTRATGKRGRPPAEFVVAGTDLSADTRLNAAVEEARERVANHRRYERLSGAVMRAANQFGHGSSEHVSAKLDRFDAFPMLPELPSKNDYVLAGVIEADEIEVEDDVLVEV